VAALTLADRAHGRDNNFHLVRMLAALLVLVSHSWPLTGTPSDPFERVVGFSLGHLGVDVFFVVSGFLVTGSLFARDSLGSFVAARARRILPALMVSAFGVALVLGPLVTSWPLDRYLTAWDTWRYALQNSITWPFGVCWTLPGVFAGNPAGPAVNGALWSLPWELTMYAMLVGLGLLLRVARLGRDTVGGLVTAIALLATVGHDANEAWGFSHRFEIVQGLRLTALFFTAGALKVHEARVPLRGSTALGALGVLTVALLGSDGLRALYPIALAYAVLWFALVPGGVLRAYRRVGDYSYGLYLWQFPIQQCLVRAWPDLSPLGLMLAAFPPTLALAMLSWHLVEARALAWRPAGRARDRKSGG
jgi:hypothetical protein